MAMIMRINARKPLASGQISSKGYAPRGVGGMFVARPTVSVTIGQVNIFLTVEELAEINDFLAKQEES